MASEKLTGLAAAVTPALTDIVYLVQDPSGAPLSTQMTLQQLLTLLDSVPNRTILGQYDTRTDFDNIVDASTVTLDYELGNAFKIDASTMGAGESFTITVSNVQAGEVYSALTVLLVTGVNLPTVSYTDLSANVSDPVIEASLQNELIGRSYDNGATWVWTVGESF